jgi:hypothetical protein
MTNQKLFEALQRVCGFTALQSDMAEIVSAVELDKMPSAETIEQAAITAAKMSEHLEAKEQAMFIAGFIECIKHQSSQPNSHRINASRLMQLRLLYNSQKITYIRMVEILNEIAAGKHKERIEI